MRKLHIPLGLLIAALLLFGCMTPKRAARLFDKIHDKQPLTSAEKCRNTFPCISSTSDTVIITETLNDLIEVTISDTVTNIDTVQFGSEKRYYITKVITKTNRVREIWKITDTKIDSAFNKIAAIKVSKLEKEKKRAWFVSYLLMGALAFSILVIIFKRK